MNEPAAICQRFKELREERGLKSKEVAKALGMSPGTYSHYEKGSRFPKLDTFYEICKYYDVDPDFLFGLNDEPHPFAKLPTSREKREAWKNASEALEHARKELYKISPR